MKTIEEIQSSENTNGMNNSEMIAFHAFNKKGLAQRRREIKDKITKLIEEKKLKSSASWVYGWNCDSYFSDNIYTLANKRRIKTTRRQVAIELLEEECNKAELYISENLIFNNEKS